jgi:hypothetical protein
MVGTGPLPVEGVGTLSRALAGNGVLLNLNTYEARLLRQSQQLLGQFFALRKARTTDALLIDLKENSSLQGGEAKGTS